MAAFTNCFIYSRCSQVDWHKQKRCIHSLLRIFTGYNDIGCHYIMCNVAKLSSSCLVLCLVNLLIIAPPHPILTHPHLGEQRSSLKLVDNWRKSGISQEVKKSVVAG